MKNINIIVLLAGVLTFSCSDFLEENPKDELSSVSNFSFPSHARNAVNSLYRTGVPQLFDGGAYSGARVMLGNYMSGFFDNEYRGQEPHVQHAQQLTLNGSNLNDYLGTTWSNLYVGIARANNAIKYIPTTPGLEEAEGKRLSAEARFFRAYAYYYLVRFFGEVPLIIEPYETLENLYVGRSTIKEVYNLIESDLKYAVNEGGLPEMPMASNNKRITKGTAATLLADVYLTMSGFPLQENRYADAAEMARSVINSGVYSLTEHDMSNGNIVLENSAYNKMRKSDASEEYIFFHEYDAAIASGTYPLWTYPTALANDVAYTITNGAYQPVPAFIRGYHADNDLRVQNKQFFHTTFTDEDGQTKNFAPTPYFWHEDAAVFEKAASGKDIPAYTYADVLLIAAEAIAKSEGVTVEAVDYLAQVRGRAYWKTDINQIENTLSSLSADNFVEEVWKERFRELVFEFHLWFDMLRTRKFPETSATGTGQISFVDLVGHQNSWGKTIENKHLLMPIPENELQRNPELEDQNPGY